MNLFDTFFVVGAATLDLINSLLIGEKVVLKVLNLFVELGYLANRRRHNILNDEPNLSLKLKGSCEWLPLFFRLTLCCIRHLIIFINNIIVFDCYLLELLSLVIVPYDAY